MFEDCWVSFMLLLLAVQLMVAVLAMMVVTVTLLVGTERRLRRHMHVDIVTLLLTQCLKETLLTMLEHGYLSI